jgi:hypothetical protein
MGSDCLASITKDYGIRYMNRLRKWWLGKTVSIVHIGLNYAVRKPHWSILRLLINGDVYEYLDLGIGIESGDGPGLYGQKKHRSHRQYTYHGISPTAQTQGGVYGMPNTPKEYADALGPAPTTIQWWLTDDTITKYCVSPDLQKVVNARNALLVWEPPTMVRLPKVAKVENVDMELAQQKLSGFVSKEK